jgi:hypothetical protein
MFRILFPLVAVVALVGIAAGCGGEARRKPTFPVSGKVLDGSKPVANATVVFHPVGGVEADVPKPRGTTAADGSFTLTSYDGNDGAPAGEYRVTVEQWLAGRPDEGPSNRLNAKLAKPESSGLTASVSTGPTELKPFDVKK